VPHDNRYAWEGGRTASGRSLRITGAALAGRPVYFDVATVGAISSERRNWFLPSRRPWAELLLAGVVVGAVAGAIVLARRNLRLGQGDPQGAKALCAVVLCGTSMWTLIAAHHVPVISEEWRLFEFAAVSSVGWAGFSWLMYMGLEPYVRRWWPTSLIGWTRLVSGRARDAIVGREVLAGLLAGVVVDALLILRFELARRGGLNLAPYNTAVDPGFNPLLESLRSGRHFAGVLTFLTLDALQFALGGLFLLVVIRMVVRRSWLAILVWTLLASALNLLEGSALGLTFLYAAATAAIAALVLLRRGLLALAVMLFCSRLLARLPLTLDLDAWYVGISVVTLCLIGALATCGFVLALARGPSVDERSC